MCACMFVKQEQDFTAHVVVNGGTSVHRPVCCRLGH